MPKECLSSSDMGSELLASWNVPTQANGRSQRHIVRMKKPRLFREGLFLTGWAPPGGPHFFCGVGLRLWVLIWTNSYCLVKKTGVRKFSVT